MAGTDDTLDVEGAVDPEPEPEPDTVVQPPYYQGADDPEPEPEPAPQLYAGKFRSPEELASAYEHLERRTHTDRQRLAQLERRQAEPEPVIQDPGLPDMDKLYSDPKYYRDYHERLNQWQMATDGVPYVEGLLSQRAQEQKQVNRVWEIVDGEFPQLANKLGHSAIIGEYTLAGNDPSLAGLDADGVTRAIAKRVAAELSPQGNGRQTARKPPRTVSSSGAGAGRRSSRDDAPVTEEERLAIWNSASTGQPVKR